jgi:hypothetical protein
VLTISRHKNNTSQNCSEASESAPRSETGRNDFFEAIFVLLLPLKKNLQCASSEAWFFVGLAAFLGFSEQTISQELNTVTGDNAGTKNGLKCLRRVNFFD